MKAVLTGIGLVGAIALTIFLGRMLWYLAIVVFPLLMLALFIYLIGYGAPGLGKYGRKVHKAFERAARQVLDWLDFNSPTWLWPAIQGARTFLDWLGLQVDN